MTDLTSKTNPHITYDETHKQEYREWYVAVHNAEPKDVNAEVLDDYYESLNCYYEHEDFVDSMYDDEDFDEFIEAEEEAARQEFLNGCYA